MSEIIRMRTTTRLSAINIHNNTVYLAGQVGDGETLKEQAESMLRRVDSLLDEAGSSRRRMLSATVYLKDMKDFDAFNEVWNSWVPAGCAPARACVQALMAAPEDLCEVAVVAALTA